jgi:hypothetical protein
VSDLSNPYASGSDFQGGSGAGEDDTLGPVPLEIGAILTRGWEVMRDNLGVIIGVVGIQIGVQIVFGILGAGIDLTTEALQQEPDMEVAIIGLALVDLVLQIVGGIINIWLGLGAIRVFVNLVYGRRAEIGMLFGETPKLFPAIIIAIAVGLATVLGILLLIVPGIIAALSLQFANYLLVDQDADIGSALSDSFKMAWPHLWFLFGFGLLIAFGAVIGTIVTCGLGLLVFAVWLPAVQAVLYQSVRARHLEAQELGLG